jgi:hypothetical protein
VTAGASGSRRPAIPAQRTGGRQIPPLPPVDLVLTGRPSAPAITTVPAPGAPPAIPATEPARAIAAEPARAIAAAPARAPGAPPTGYAAVPTGYAAVPTGYAAVPTGYAAPDPRPAGPSAAVPVAPTSVPPELAGRGPTGRLRRSDPAVAGSAWWSRGGGPSSPPTGGAAAPAPPEVPVIGGVTASGLPVRVPLAQLPPEEAAAPPGAPAAALAPAAESDPEDVGSTLARFYGGVRRAEAEETMQQPAVPSGPRWREEQQ